MNPIIAGMIGSSERFLSGLLYDPIFKITKRKNKKTKKVTITISI